MLEGIVKEFMSSAQGSSLLSQLNDQGLSPDKAEEAVQATAEGAVKHGASAGLDLSSLFGGPEGGLGAMAGAFGGTPRARMPLEGGTLQELDEPVTRFVEQKGFPPRCGGEGRGGGAAEAGRAGAQTLTGAHPGVIAPR